MDQVSESEHVRHWQYLVIYVLIRPVENCPFGYPRVAAFMDSDDNFMIYRRFGFLYSRVLLDKQDELREMEADLDSIDQSDAQGLKTARTCLQSRSKDNRCNDVNDENTRRALLRKAEKVLYTYGEADVLN